MKRRFFSIVAWLVIILASHLLLQYSTSAAEAYHNYIFQPWQYLRSSVTKVVSISIGDIFYCLLGISCLLAVIRWVFWLFCWHSRKEAIGEGVLSAVSSVLGIYFLLLIGWGGNYFQPALSKRLSLPESAGISQQDIIAFDSVLISRLNAYAPSYNDQPLELLNVQAAKHVRAQVANRYQSTTLSVKPSLFSRWIAYMGVEGYYNPFTGEGQIDRNLPPFMLPFVICHEMAHQSGIAAEDDANLMAYISGVQSQSATFRYSASFNIWLYAHYWVRMTDSVAAKRLKQQLNPLTIAHLDTLKQRRRRYQSNAAEYSSRMFDYYLKMEQQKEGIESYRNVAFTALAWERKKKLIWF